MPIKVQSNLPAIKVLESENIFVMPNEVALKQDIRPLKILILNLMPTKIATETQLLRLLGNSPLQVDIELLQMATHTSKNTSPHHLTTFYKTFDQVKHDYFDGLIITGAPVEQIPFEEVDYWDELCEIMAWSNTNVYSTFREEEIRSHLGLEILAISDEAGPSVISNRTGRQVFITGHAEYDRDTLANEYFRDISRGLEIEVPKNYFPDDDASLTPPMVWRSNATLLYTNWLNYFVYQATPYDLSTLNKYGKSVFQDCL